MPEAPGLVMHACQHKALSDVLEMRLSCVHTRVCKFVHLFLYRNSNLQLLCSLLFPIRMTVPGGQGPVYLRHLSVSGAEYRIKQTICTQ